MMTAAMAANRRPSPPPERQATMVSDTRWNAQDVGFFDPYYEGKTVSTGGPVSHSGKDTFFRDIHLFVSRIKDIAAVKDPKLVRDNLWTCLRGRALEWWQSVLTDEQKRLVKFGDSVDEWVKALEKRFKESPSDALNTITTSKYTFDDARRRRDPVDYALALSRAAKATDVPVYSQLYFIYNGLESEFRRDLTRPTSDTTMDQFLKQMEDNKEIWWDIAASRGRSHVPSGYSTNRSANTSSFRPSGQQGSYNSGYRPSNSSSSGGFPPRGYGYGPGYPAAGSQNPAPRQTQYPTSYQFGQNRTYQNQQSNQPQYSKPPPAGAGQPYGRGPPTQPYQPTTAMPGATMNRPATAPNAFGLQPKQQFQPTQPAQQASRPYNNYNSQNVQRQPFGQRPNPAVQGRAYHGDEDRSTPENPEADTYHIREDHDDYSPFDYQYDDAVGENSHEPEESTADENELRAFFAASPEMTFTCRRCSEKFPSNNKLHYHIRRCKVTKPAAAAASRTIDAFHSQSTSPKVVHSTAPAEAHPGHGFRSWRYAKVQASINPDDPEDLDDLCPDTGCGSSMVDRPYLASKRPDYAKDVIHTDTMKVNGIGSSSLSTSERIPIEFTIPGEVDGEPAVARFTRHVYIVEELKAKLLLGNDILGPEDMVPHLGKGKLAIGSCGNFTAPLTVTPRAGERVKRTIRAQAVTTVPPHSVSVIPVKFRGSRLPTDRDYMFNPNHLERLGKEGGVFSHIVDANFGAVQVRNATDKPISIPKNERLGVLQEYEEEGCYLASPEHRHLAAGNWVKKAMKLGVAALAAFQGVTSLPTVASSPTVTGLSSPGNDTAAASVPTINTGTNTGQEYTTPTGITVYGTESSAAALAEVAESYPSLWTEDGSTVKLPPDEWMPITLQPDATVQPSKVYPVSQADKDFIDKEFDKLQAQGKLEYTTQPTPYSYPVFVVWRTVYHPGRPPERKGRVVVDIRGLNKITELDTYPMPLQADITALVAGCPYISVFDAASFFYQWLVRLADRHKLTVVSHRGQEQFNVAVMGYKNSPPYVQRKIDALLRTVRRFARAYVDDIVVFSRTLEEHKAHLHEVFSILDSYGIRLAPKKSYLGYPTVALLGQKVDAFGLTITADKLAAIANLRFPRTLKDLEGYLGFTGWLRNYIAWYAQKSDPLQKRKTMLLRSSPSSKGRQRKVYSASTVLQQPSASELESYRQLQEAFNKASLLVHHDPTRVTYIDVDASKRRGFGVIIYHLKDGANPDQPKRTDIEPIMFLSRMLTSAEERYWPTELEMAGLVWVVRRARHIIEASQHPTVVYTDHAANTGIAKQTTLSSSNTDKLNLRLVRASTYLFQFRLDVRYRPGKRHVIPDALSRLSVERSFLDEDSRNVDLESYNTSLEDSSAGDNNSYRESLVIMSSAFRQQLLNDYVKKSAWRNLIKMLSGLKKRVQLKRTKTTFENSNAFVNKSTETVSVNTSSEFNRSITSKIFANRKSFVD